MEKNVFVVCVKIGLQMKYEFEGTLLSFDAEAGRFTFGECDGNMLPVARGGMVVLDLVRRAAAFSYAAFSMTLDIIGHKKVGDNYHFKCATDLCRVDVFICEKSLWNDKKEAIFF